MFRRMRMVSAQAFLLGVVTIVFLAGTSALAKGPKDDKGPQGKGPRKALAKNIIMLISDGCGYNQVDAASLYQYGKTGMQVYEKFPVRAGMSTYMDGASYDPLLAWTDWEYVKSNATDSAAAATTMSTGEKTYSGAIGVDVNSDPLEHFMEAAEELGKSTGVVSSVEFSHATPAGFIAHNISRNNYTDIAFEMIYESAADVIMGCGAPDYDNNGEQPFSGNPKYVGGPATWTDLIDDYLVTGADANGDGTPDDWTVIRSREQFQSLAAGETPARVIGIPYVYQTLQYNRDGDYAGAVPYEVPLIQTVPTLAEMTAAALNVLDNNEEGFCLMVEGGAVDWAGHGNSSARVIEEEIDFNRSVEVVVAWVQANSNWGETVVIVTGDHETGYLTAPYDFEPDASAPLINNGTGELPGMQWSSGSHTNQLIPFYAKGDAARLFNWAAVDFDPVRGGYLDNTAIGAMAFEILGAD
jgi:alkaline phosphatase